MVGFGHPHKVPPNNRMLQINSLTRMKLRFNQMKSYRTFNGGRAWSSYAEMFEFDPKWNGTMTRGGWTIHNIHLLDQLIEMAFDDLWYTNRSATPNYFNKRQHSVEAWYRVKASEFFEKDPSLTGAQITSKCHAKYNAAHQNMMEHRAQSMVPDPSIRFPDFWSHFSDSRPSTRRRPDQYDGPLSAVGQNY